MFFTFMTIGILIFTLISRAKRGERISVRPRRWEKIFVVNLKAKPFHFHHSYLGIIILLFGYFWSWWIDVGLALIVSDVIFHIIAHFYWGDPVWD